MADFGAMFIKATTPAPVARTAMPDVDAPAWAARVASAAQEVIALAAFNAGLADVLPAPVLTIEFRPEAFELARLARKAEGKAPKYAYAGQAWDTHVMPGLLAALKAHGATITQRVTAGSPGDVFVSMAVPEKLLGETILLPDSTIPVHSMPLLIFNPAGMTKLIKGLAKDPGYQALVKAFADAKTATDVPAAIREAQAQASAIMTAARVTA